MKKIRLMGIICLLALGILASPGWAMVGDEQNTTGRAAIAPARPLPAATKVLSLQSTSDCSAILVAGKKYPVGVVEINLRQTFNPLRCWLDVRYVIDKAGYAFKDIHFQVAECPEHIPQANGNPIPGQFTYKKKFKSPYVVTEHGFEYELPCDLVPPLVIAAHASVMPTLATLTVLAGGDDQATIRVTYPVAGGPSYFPQVIVSDAGDLNGTYLGWCVDTDRVIYQNTDYCAQIVSSYAPLAQLQPLVEYPENLDLVNWIINQDFVGQASPGGFGIYTYGDVQRAIWELIDDTPSTAGLGAWNQNRVNEIKAAAQENGEGFLPGCGQKLAVLFKPGCGDPITAQVIIAQVIITETMVPCTWGSQTAWGAMKCWNAEKGKWEYRCPFPGKNWALFFTCPADDPCVCPSCPPLP